MQTIDIFPWNDHFNTGIKTIDEQHRQLVLLLNRLATLVAYHSFQEELNSILDELTQYTLYHFQTEEAIWNKHLDKDPLEGQHQEVHQKFIDTVLRLKQEQDIKPLSELADEALGFLARWLASHILESDRFMAHVILALEEGKNLTQAKQYATEEMSGSNRILIEIILSIYATLSSNTLRLMGELQKRELYEEKVRYNEIALSNEKDFLKTLLKAIPDLVWMKDPNGVYLSCNERFEDFFGEKEEAIVGKTDYDFVEKSLADFFRMHDKTVMRVA